jgi:serine/threonine-protein kinase HipA
MRKCLSCYKELEEMQVDYHPGCISAFFGTRHAPVLPYHLSELEKLAQESARLSISVPGVQPKLSLGLIKTALENGHQGRLTIMDALEGHFILKPRNAEYPQMPENEHLSMKLAKLFKIDIVPVNMIRLASGELCFITRRIDRNPDGSKNHMIDFLQILELESKYKGTMETLGKTIGNLSVNTLLDRMRFFEATVFNYIIGNNDMHLKNFSMFLSETGWVLSPFYDLLNVKMILPEDKEDMALLLGGKKENFNKGYFDRLAVLLNLNDKQINSVYKRLIKWQPEADQWIERSFLETERQIAYKKLIAGRIKIFHP